MEELILKDVRAELDGQADAVEFVSIIDKHNEEVKWRRSIDFINMIVLMLNRIFGFFFQQVEMTKMKYYNHWEHLLTFRRRKKQNKIHDIIICQQHFKS